MTAITASEPGTGSAPARPVNGQRKRSRPSIDRQRRHPREEGERDREALAALVPGLAAERRVAEQRHDV